MDERTYKLGVICEKLQSMCESAIIDADYGIMNEAEANEGNWSRFKAGAARVASSVWEFIKKYWLMIAAFAKKAWLGIVKFFTKKEFKNNIGILTADVALNTAVLKGPDSGVLSSALKLKLDDKAVDKKIEALKSKKDEDLKRIPKGSSFNAGPLIKNGKKASEDANRMAGQVKEQADKIRAYRADNNMGMFKRDDDIDKMDKVRDMFKKAGDYYNAYVTALNKTLETLQSNIDSIDAAKKERFGGFDEKFRTYKSYDQESDPEYIKARRKQERKENSALTKLKNRLKRNKSNDEEEETVNTESFMDLDLLRAKCLIEAAEALDNIVVENPNEDYKEPNEINDAVEEEMDEYDADVNGGGDEDFDYDEFDDLAGLDGKDSDDAVDTMTDDEGSETFSEAISSLLYGMDDDEDYDW